MGLQIAIPNRFTPRPYQAQAMRYFDGGGKRGVYCWPRRSGKDRTFLHQTAKAGHQRIGTYYHLLPSHTQARKVIWDALDGGERVIDQAFPIELRASTNETEMKIRFRNGSLWQLVGADYYDSLMGSNPVGMVISEAALTDPRAWNFFRPILAENGGWAAFVSTPRGYNWFHDILAIAKADPSWGWSHLASAQTEHIPQAVLDTERAQMPDELYRQEYETDFSAANIGAILGRYLESAEKEGRVCEFAPDDGPLEVSCDIGFRDTASFWFWQPKHAGFDLIDYAESSGLDADDWIDKLKARGTRYARIWLPHDAKVRTFQSKHSTLERFLLAFGGDVVRVVPDTKRPDRVNAARMVIQRCRFHSVKCAQGLAGLRAWSYEYNEETRAFSREPKHDWASHPGDGYSYGAVVMAERALPVEKKPPYWVAPRIPTFNEVIAAQTRAKERRI